MPTRSPVLVVAFGLTAGVSAVAQAQTAVLADFGSSPELAESAAAVSLLVRSMIVPGAARPILAQDRLAVALGSSGTPAASLVVDPSMAMTVMERTQADRLVLGRLTAEGGVLTVAVAVLGPTGASLGDASASAPEGEWVTLAQDVARRVAPRLEATVDARINVALWELRPFVAAQLAARAGDRARAAAELQAASPATARRVGALKDLGALWIKDEAADADQRLHAALVTDATAAMQLADQRLATDDGDKVARAARVRAFLALRRLTEAENEMAKLPREGEVPASARARADLALAFADKEERRAALDPLLKDKGQAPYALAMVAGVAPGVLGNDLEKAVLRVATEQAKEHPAVVSAVALRALRGRVDARTAVGLVRLEDVARADVEPAREALDKLAADGDVTARRLLDEVAARAKLAAETRGAGPGKVAAAPLGGAAAEAAGLLERSGVLAGKSLESILIVPMPGAGQPPYWPFRIDLAGFRKALAEALAGAPLGLVVTDLPSNVEWGEDSATEERLKKLADDGVGAVLMYRARAERENVRFTFVSVDTGSLNVTRGGVVTSFGETTFAHINLIPIVAALVLLVAASTLLFKGVAQLRGAIVVSITEDPGAKDELLTIVIARTQKIDRIKDPTAYELDLRRRGKTQTKQRAYNAGAQTRFLGLAGGKWYVHLLGTYKKADERRMLDDSYVALVTVRRGRTEFVAFNLVPTYAEFYIEVMDGKEPVKGARAWVEGPNAKAVPTDEKGRCFLQVPRGQQTIWVEARGMKIPRPLTVFKTDAHELAINLVWERRVDDASRALEKKKT